MKHDAEINAEQVLRGTTAPTCPGAAIGPISAAEVVAVFRRRFEAGPGVGIWKRIFDALLEEANPFDAKSRRRMRQEAIILGTLISAAIVLATYFNLSGTSR